VPYVLDAAEMREIDRLTIEEIGIPAAVLMDHAGRAVADEVTKLAPPGARVAVLCGSGNNGGDGFSCARWLRERGYDARVYLARSRPRPGGEAALHLHVYERLQGPVAEIPDAASLSARAAEIAGAAVVVDALLGTGLATPVGGHLADVIALINAAPGIRVAVDIPSGLSSDTGATLGASVAAQRTVTLAFPKVGVVSHPGCERAGAVTVADIGIPRSLAARQGIRLSLMEAAEAARLVPGRSLGSHKGSHGHVLVIAGSAGKAGAALLAAGGALRGGAGLVTLATAPDARALVEARVPEVMTATLDAEAAPAGALAALAALAAGKRAVVWGPGIPTSEECGAFLRAAIPALDVPLVLDADGLNHLAHDLSAAPRARAPLVLTPHPGEAARLLGVDAAAVQADRVGAARRLAAAAGAVVVLKGARSVVAAPDGTASINPTGNPGMGTGGTGDVLAGVIGALVAQGLAPYDAARLGVYAHGRAGDLAAAERGVIGLRASDLLAQLPRALTF
jgi:ADP-dependent NAD(P)H-hydrate dehydratase / NAD(P)H-hydrate epimerase